MKIKAKKSFGQHWLRSKKALQQIIAAGDIHTTDIILEIGPGQGILTERLLKLAGQVIAVEKDKKLISFLKEKFATEIKQGKLDLIEGDILKFDPKVLKRKYKIIANIPYYITGAILKKFLTSENQPTRMVILVQKEVAEQIVAAKGKESLLSISVKFYGEPKIIAKVPRGAFTPPPKVNSTILAIVDISKKSFKKAGVKEKDFFKVIKAGFAHKRKLLTSNLAVLAEKEKVLSALKSCKIKENSRAEDLSLADWLCLAAYLRRQAPKSVIIN